MTVPQPAHSRAMLRIEEPVANLVTVANVPTARPEIGEKQILYLSLKVKVNLQTLRMRLRDYLRSP